jgi:hypothetical protein
MATKSSAPGFSSAFEPIFQPRATASEYSKIGRKSLKPDFCRVLFASRQ